MAAEASWPSLPADAAYLNLNNAAQRNALSKEVLLDLRRQLWAFNTSPRTGKLMLLPPFNPEILPTLEASTDPHHAAAQEFAWLTTAQGWRDQREGLPNVLVLRSLGPVFSAGHNLQEMRDVPYEKAQEIFALCAEVMALIRRSPVPVIGVIHGLATAAGCQLALTTDLPIARASTPFRLPGAARGMPCSSPSTIVSRRAGNAFGYQMLATADTYRADQLPNCGLRVIPDSEDFEANVADVIHKLTNMPPRPQALGKWVYWTQAGLGSRSANGDAYEEALQWTGRVMALHTQSDEAQEGIKAFLEKRPPKWKL